MRAPQLPRFLLPIAAVAAGLTIAGCPITPQQNFDPTHPRLRPFNSPGELVSYVRDQAVANTAVSQRGGVLNFGAAPAMAEDAAGGASGDAGTQTFSTTNLQEEGVDESDVLKSDGTYFYLAKENSLRIVRASPQSELAEVGRVDLDVWIDSLYLRGGHILVVGQMNSYTGGPGGPGMPEIMIWPPYYPSADVAVVDVDVSNPAAPTIARKIELDGALVSSRLVNNRLVLVLTVVPDLPTTPTRFNTGGLTADELLPKARVGDTETIAVEPTDVLRPDEPNGVNMTMVAALDADNIESIVGSTAVVANAGVIYASTKALYLTDTDYSMDEVSREYTAVHKLAFDSNGVAQYVASGAVPGRPLNQFSLSEHDDTLRIATHVQNFQLWTGGPMFMGLAVDRAQSADDAVAVAPTEPYNGVYVLGEREGELKTLGSIENIAPGERIYAARFIGERGYLVTFRQIDPLWVMDLSNPESPRIVGELHIPGYSDYLHPLGERHLIGVGRSTATTQWGGTVPDALQLSLFDISDPANPVRTHVLEIGGPGSYSDVSFTHKAFTFLPAQGLLAIPATLYRDGANRFEYPGYEFDGALFLRVNAESGFTALGRLATVYQNPQFYPYSAWRRAAVIGETAFAVGPEGVRAAPLSNLSASTSVVLPPNPGFEGMMPGVEGDGAMGNPGR